MGLLTAWQASSPVSACEPACYLTHIWKSHCAVQEDAGSQLPEDSSTDLGELDLDTIIAEGNFDNETTIPGAQGAVIVTNAAIASALW